MISEPPSIPDQLPSNSSSASAAAGKRPSIAATASGVEVFGFVSSYTTPGAPGACPTSQANVAIVGKLTHGVDQRIGAGIVDAIGDLDPILQKLIIQLQQLEGLPCASCARAQDGIDRNALRSQVVAHFERMAFAVGGEPSLAVLASGSYIFGLRMTEYEQGASLVHPRSLSLMRPA